MISFFWRLKLLFFDSICFFFVQLKTFAHCQLQLAVQKFIAVHCSLNGTTAKMTKNAKHSAMAVAAETTTDSTQRKNAKQNAKTKIKTEDYRTYLPNQTSIELFSMPVILINKISK